MSHARLRDADPAPAAYRGHGSIGHASYGGRAPERINEAACIGFHAPQCAIIGNQRQAPIFDIRDCDYRTRSFNGLVTNDDIRAALKAKGMTQRQLAGLLGIAENKITKALIGERRWTVSEMDIVREVLGDADQGTAAPPPRAIPIIGQVQAGNWREAVRQAGSSVPAPDPSLPPNVFALRVKGDSMDAYVRDGGVAMVDPDDKDLFEGRLYVVLNEDGETTFKKFEVNPARLMPCSSNDEHQPIPLGNGPIEVVGRIVWLAYRP
jgi:repressor LexA